MSKRAMPTRGWRGTIVNGRVCACTITSDTRDVAHLCIRGEPDYEWQSNGDLMLAASKAADACADMGFDPIRCVEQLPKLVEALQETLKCTAMYSQLAGQITAQSVGAFPGIEHNLAFANEWGQKALDTFSACCPQEVPND